MVSRRAWPKQENESEKSGQYGVRRSIKQYMGQEVNEE